LKDSRGTFVILVDVGNTSATLGLSADGTIARRARLPTASHTAANIRRVIGRLVGRRTAAAAVFCSVVPRVDKRWLRELARFIGRNVVVVSHRTRLGLKLKYPRPQTIGADRLADACGAAWYHGVPAIVVDIGTATTFDVVSGKREFLGGIIAPGPVIMRDCLAARTALLPKLRGNRTCRGIGRSTAAAMRIGASVGYRGLVRELTLNLLEETGRRGVRLCATGGYAATALKGLDLPFTIDPDLTLRGLWKIHELNGRRP